MKILVTGGNGFLGRHVVKLLQDKHDVTTFSRRNAGTRQDHSDAVIGREVQIPNPHLPHIKGDVTDAQAITKACQGIDAVFHIASKVGIVGRWEEFYNVNVVGTQNVIDACLQNGVRYLVYTSTPSVVFNGENIRNATESLPYTTEVISPYARSKAIAEQHVLSANGHQLKTIAPHPQHLKTIALRPHLIWGVGDPHLIPQILNSAIRKTLFIIGKGKNLVDITHVKDAARAHVLALEALEKNPHACGKAYFISQGEPVRLWEWINDLLFKLHLTPAKRKIPFPIAYALGTVLEKLRFLSPPPMTRFLATQLAMDHYFDINAAKQDLGYIPQTSPEESLSELIEAVKSQYR
jgi:2-alkyl-3-oxoalkanoate reductase